MKKSNASSRTELRSSSKSSRKTLPNSTRTLKMRRLMKRPNLKTSSTRSRRTDFRSMKQDSRVLAKLNSKMFLRSTSKPRRELRPKYQSREASRLRI